MGGFMTKAEIAEWADRLGVDLEGLSWPQQQKAVIEAKQKAGYPVQYGKTAPKPKDEIDAIDVRDLPVELAPRKKEAAPQELVVGKGRRRQIGVDPRRTVGKKTLISPEIQPTQYQLIKYDEDLGPETEIEEISLKDEFEQGRDVLVDKDLSTETYRIKGRGSRHVIAQSTIPKENAKITFEVGKDLVPVVEFMGRKGYLWTHHRLPNVKALLVASGYYEEYKDRFKDEPNIWHSAGKLLTCDITLVENVFREIERKEKDRRRVYGNQG